MNSPLDNVYELLQLGYGDTYRLEYIKKRLENGKILYISDNDYLQKLVNQYSGEIQKVVEHKKPEPTLPTPDPTPEPTPEPKDIPTPKIEHVSENMKSSKNEKVEPTGNSFCSNCGNPIKNENFCSKCGSSKNLDIEKISLETNNTKSKNGKKMQKKSIIIIIFLSMSALFSSALFPFPYGMIIVLLSVILLLWKIIKLKVVLVVFGIFLIMSAGVVFFLPINDIGMTIGDLSNLCKGPLGVIAGAFGGAENCYVINSIAGLGIIAGIIGIILTVVGIIKRNKVTQ